MVAGVDPLFQKYFQLINEYTFIPVFEREKLFKRICLYCQPLVVLYKCSGFAYIMYGFRSDLTG